MSFTNLRKAFRGSNDHSLEVAGRVELNFMRFRVSTDAIVSSASPRADQGRRQRGFLAPLLQCTLLTLMNVAPALSHHDNVVIDITDKMPRRPSAVGAPGCLDVENEEVVFREVSDMSSTNDDGIVSLPAGI